MDFKYRSTVTANIIYGITILLFITFFIYIGISESNSVYRARQPESANIVKNYSTEVVFDADSPSRMHKEYSWKLHTIKTPHKSLSFFTSNEYVDVYFDDTLMYSLKPSTSNRICNSVGNSWVILPLLPEDSKKEVRICITPLYKTHISGDPTFIISSQSALYREFLTRDYPALLLSLICITMGVLILITGIMSQFKKRKLSPDAFYIGLISVFIGLWRITDTQSIAYVFSDAPVLLSYISIGVICLITIPAFMFLQYRLKEINPILMPIFSIVISLIAIVFLVLQITGTTEFIHFRAMGYMIATFTLLTCFVSTVLAAIRSHTKERIFDFIYASMLLIGFLVDMVNSYIEGTPTEIVFLVLAFAIYDFAYFLRNVVETNTMAYIDAQTGLFNKARWDEHMKTNLNGIDNICIMMLDLNELKVVNDTLGHDAGDRMIYNFANILKNTLPSNSLICRWGGDEFTVMITDTSTIEIKRHISNIHSAVDAHNNSGKIPSIHFAAGYAIAKNSPDLDKSELLKEADKHMYDDKYTWYLKSNKPYKAV